MTNQNNTNQKLFSKMQAEYFRFLDELEKKQPEEIIDSSYEKVCKEDILAIVGGSDLSPEVVDALLKEEYPLDFCYQAWMDADVTDNEGLRSVVSRMY